MRYGYFDDVRKEYVITNPRTPTPWINYIGLGEYGGIVTQTGGGYSFDRDPRNKRVLRYRYNAIPMDQPGRYVYLRDEETGEYWSITWQPTTQIELDWFEARHGMGYTKISSRYKGIEASIKYFVPLNESLEIWHVKVKNLSTKPRVLKAFTYAEFSFFDAMKDQTNVDWVQQIQQGYYENNTIFWNAFMKTWDYIYIHSSGNVSSFDTSLEVFVGKYRSLANPIAVERGYCSNSLAKRGNGVGALANDIELEPGEEYEFVIILGVIPEIKDAWHYIDKYGSPSKADKAFEKLNEYWDNFLSKIKVETPDPDINRMVNIWNQYQCNATFNWSRFVSMYQLGINRGMGFRDSAQDVLGVLHTIPERAKQLIIKLLKIQFSDGHAYHQFYPLTGEGAIGDAEEGPDEAPKWYSDDHLWIILSITSYIKETGDFDFLKEVVSYVDGGEGTVLEHMEKAIEFSLNHVGEHGLLKLGWADWNDTLNLSRTSDKAESVFTTMLFGKALLEMKELFEHLGVKDKADSYREKHERFKKVVHEQAWDGKWFIRAYAEDGSVIGSNKNEKGKIFLEPQPWAFMAEFVSGNDERGKAILESIEELLNTQYGIVLLWPAYDKFDEKIGGTTTYPPGAKENGGIFCHTNPWVMIAEVLAGRRSKAFQYYKQILPSTRNDIADLYEVEPYVYAQNILGKEHPQFGLARNSWLSGTAAWNFVAITQYILGIRPTYEGLVIDPQFPDTWENVKIERIYRGKKYIIEIKNQSGRREKPVCKLNGKEFEYGTPIIGDKSENYVEIIL